MSTSRKLHLGAFVRPVSIHTGAWRYPGAYPDGNFNFAHLRTFARRLEAAKFDAFRCEYEGSTLRDHLGLLRPPNRLF